MGYTSSILGQYESLLEASNSPQEHDDSLDQSDFLTLLITQLTNQDPLNPLDDTEMTAQLAQFSSLEQLTSINDGIQTLIDGSTQEDLLSAVSFIGKEVKAQGYNITKDGESVSTVYYGFDETVSEVTVYIYDAEGALIRTEVLGAKQAGSYEYQWDGKDDAGVDQPGGVYSIGMLGEDTDGQPVLIQTEVSGVVSGVVSENGVQYLRLADGRYISFLNVTEVVAGSSSSEGEEE
ncbi:MAG: flagellar hook assembly protein FlgD [Desulfovibrionaceae bacterium]|nr:flagellar hook assembly protein FlgD [Desulfovibrionaceae bacterium]